MSVESRRRPIVTLTLTITLLSMTPMACSTGAQPPAPANPPSFLAGDIPGLTTTFENVAWADGTTVVDASAVAAGYRPISDDGSTLRFAASDALRALRQGQIAVLPGLAVGRITAVAETAGELVIATEAVSLNEIIRDGRLGYDLDLQWDQLPAAAWQEAAASKGLQVVAAGPALDLVLASALDPRGHELHFAGDVEGFQVDFRLSPKAEGLFVSLSATRVNMRVEVNGTVSGFRHSSHATFAAGADSKRSHGQSGAETPAFGTPCSRQKRVGSCGIGYLPPARMEGSAGPRVFALNGCDGAPLTMSRR